LSLAAGRELHGRILPFWLAMKDSERGGFFGAALGRDHPLREAEKGAVLHARILWMFSTAFAHRPHPAYLDAARHAYAFLSKRLIDSSSGGVFLTVTADGAPADTRKHLYAQAFAIYGLAAYHGAEGDPSALDLARTLWALVETRASHPQGGYREAFTRDWLPASNDLMGCVDAVQSFNTHLHLLEACGALWSVWPDPALGSRLESLMDLLIGEMLDRRRSTFRQFFDADGAPLDEGLSFGHDIEASWLIRQIAQNVSPALAQRAHSALRGVAGAVLNEALTAGGAVRSGMTPAGHPDRRRHWWVQAEALVGFLDAFEWSGDHRYLSATEAVWRYIQRRMIDAAGGEWRSLVDPWRPIQKRGQLAHLWKCPYHNGRACLEIMDRVNRLLQQG
jgi:mannobiose 2-epimerase